MAYKVSTIIPFYNTADVIERCCEALFGQTLESLEFIFVDDCSSDGSSALIEKTLNSFPSRKDSVRILRQSAREGVSACRQLGLDNASGEYVIHCDSDDYPEPDAYETLLNAAQENDAEIVCCDFFIEGLHSGPKTVRFPDRFLSRPSFRIDPIEGSLFNKLISRSLIDRSAASFPEGIGLGEDFAFVTPCRICSRKTVSVHKLLYHHIWRSSGSITSDCTEVQYRQLVEVAGIMESWLDGRGLQQEYARELDTLKFLTKMPFLMFSEIRDIEFWNSVHPECHRHILSYPAPLYVKVAATLIKWGLKRTASAWLSLKSLVTGR